MASLAFKVSAGVQIAFRDMVRDEAKTSDHDLSFTMATPFLSKHSRFRSGGSAAS